MRSEGMAKEMPAATLSVLMPMTSPSWAGRPEWTVTPGAQAATAFNCHAQHPGPQADLAGSARWKPMGLLGVQGAAPSLSGQGPPASSTIGFLIPPSLPLRHQHLTGTPTPVPMLRPLPGRSFSYMSPFPKSSVPIVQVRCSRLQEALLVPSAASLPACCPCRALSLPLTWCSGGATSDPVSPMAAPRGGDCTCRFSGPRRSELNFPIYSVNLTWEGNEPDLGRGQRGGGGRRTSLSSWA